MTPSERAVQQLKKGLKATLLTGVQVGLVAYFTSSFEHAMFLLVVLALWEVQLVEVGFGSVE